MKLQKRKCFKNSYGAAPFAGAVPFFMFSFLKTGAVPFFIMQSPDGICFSLCNNHFCRRAETRHFLLCNIYQIFAVIFGKNPEVIAVEFGIERRIAEEIMVAVFGPVLFRHL